MYRLHTCEFLYHLNNSHINIIFEFCAIQLMQRNVIVWMFDFIILSFFIHCDETSATHSIHQYHWCYLRLLLLLHFVDALESSVMQLINTLMHQPNSLITQNWLLSPFLERSVTHGIPHLMSWTNARRRARENKQNQPRKWKTNTNWQCTFDHSLCLLLLYVVCTMCGTLVLSIFERLSRTANTMKSLEIEKPLWTQQN